MSDATDDVGIREELAGGAVTFTAEPATGGGVQLAVKHNGEAVVAGTHKKDVFERVTPRGAFLNSVEDSLQPRGGVDAGDVRRELKELFAELAEIIREEEADVLLSEEVQAIIDGTHYPVEIYDGEPTVWKVTLEFAGHTRDLEFTAAEMVSGSGAALEEKIANRFFEMVEIAEEDWNTIRDRWHNNSHVAYMSDETTSDAVADRVLEFLGDGVLPLEERDKLVNAPSNAWADETNAAGYSDAPPEAPIVWVQDRYLVNKLESAGKTLEYKGQLVKDLINRGDLYGKSTRRKWGDGTRRKYYPFTPDALRVDLDQIGEPDDGDAAGEVDA